MSITVSSTTKANAVLTSGSFFPSTVLIIMSRWNPQNMIPVLESCLIRFDIQEVKDTKYKMLLLNQLEYCNKNRDLILQRAETTYRKALSRKIPLYQKVCCNFEKLERKSKKYDPNYVPSKKKIHATVPSK